MNAGLNLLRFFLAFNVVIFHLWNAAAPGAGPVAVLGFFFISGFLITQIVQEVYPMPARTRAFLRNRALRIYPQYLVALGLGLLSIHLYPDVAFHINSYLRLPATASEWRDQFDIFGLTAKHWPRLEALMKQYSDLPMDLADASLVLLAEEQGDGRVLTTDRRDFHAYRWKTRKPFKNLLDLDD